MRALTGRRPRRAEFRIFNFAQSSRSVEKKKKKKALMPSVTLLLRVAIGGISPLLKAWKNEERIMLLARISNSFPYFSLFLFLLARITPVGSEKDPPDGARIAMFHFQVSRKYDDSRTP